METGAYFQCRKTSHITKDCPLMKMDQGDKVSDKLKPKVRGCVFALTEKDVEASNTVVTGIILLFDHEIRVLIDLGSAHSFISTSLVDHMDITLEPLDFELAISTPLGTVVC